MTRRPDWIKRGPRLTKAEHEEMRIAQGGVCAWPGCKSTGPFEEDHGEGADSVALGNTGKPKRLLCVPHNRKSGVKTAQVAAKADRQGLRAGPQARLRRRKAQGLGSKLQSRRKIVSAGFDKRVKRKMDGTTVRRVEG